MVELDNDQSNETTFATQNRNLVNCVVHMWRKMRVRVPRGVAYKKKDCKKKSYTL